MIYRTLFEILSPTWWIENDGGVVPGSVHVNGFSPVCDRMWDIRAKRDVWARARRGHVAHSQV